MATGTVLSGEVRSLPDQTASDSDAEVWVTSRPLTDLSTIDILIASLYHQFSMYVCVRLARKGFTLGELGIVSGFSSALFMEVVNLTRARVRSSSSLLRLPF